MLHRIEKRSCDEIFEFRIAPIGPFIRVLRHWRTWCIQGDEALKFLVCAHTLASGCASITLKQVFLRLLNGGALVSTGVISGVTGVSRLISTVLVKGDQNLNADSHESFAMAA